MVDYAYIQNYSKAGKLGISLKVFEDIATNVVTKIKGADTKKEDKTPLQFHKPIRAEYKNGNVIISIQIVISQGFNIDSICTSIQEGIAEELAQMCEMVPFEIKIKVAGIK